MSHVARVSLIAKLLRGIIPKTQRLLVDKLAEHDAALDVLDRTYEKTMTNGVLTPLFSVDMDQTLGNDHVGADDTWSAKMFFAVEAGDGTDLQIRSGHLDANVALQRPSTWANSQKADTTGATTVGTITPAFSWTFAGTIATLNVTTTSGGMTPTHITLSYRIVFTTHPGALTYL